MEVGHPGLAAKIRASAELIALRHTVFALPFAFMGMLLAAGGLPTLRTVGFITVAMVGARTAAMAFNRLADHRFDSENPRTAGRPLPSGRLSRRWARGLLLASSALFVIAAAALNHLCFYLSPLALALILSYSLTKRFTSLTHLHLGAALGLAPVGAWIAVRGSIEAAPLILGAAVTCWTAGFDIIYACQDREYDLTASLHSLPARLGIAGALKVSTALHVLMVIALAALPILVPLGYVYAIGVIGVGVILAFEHRMVRPDDLSRVNAAFFSANGWISVGLLAATLIDIATFGA
jgi:4-hydroxybenzoate polyprenyltransferase